MAICAQAKGRISRWPKSPAVPDAMVAEYERVKRELEQMREMKAKYEELRSNHEKLKVENEEVRKIVGDMCAPVEEDEEAGPRSPEMSRGEPRLGTSPSTRTRRSPTSTRRRTRRLTTRSRRAAGRRRRAS